MWQGVILPRQKRVSALFQLAQRSSFTPLDDAPTDELTWDHFVRIFSPFDPTENRTPVMVGERTIIVPLHHLVLTCLVRGGG